MHAADVHFVAELHLALVHPARNRGRTGGIRRAGQRNVPLTSEQAAGRIQPNPARAGQIHLAPGVQVR